MVKKKQETLRLHAMTKGGAGSLLKFYRDKLNCKLVEDPKMHTDNVQWTFVVTKPEFKDV